MFSLYFHFEKNIFAYLIIEIETIVIYIWRITQGQKVSDDAEYIDGLFTYVDRCGCLNGSCIIVLMYKRYCSRCLFLPWYIVRRQKYFFVTNRLMRDVDRQTSNNLDVWKTEFRFDYICQVNFFSTNFLLRFKSLHFYIICFKMNFITTSGFLRQLFVRIKYAHHQLTN